MIKANLLVFLGMGFIGTFAKAAPCAQMQLQIMNGTNIDLSSSPSRAANLVVKADTRDGGCDFFVTVSNGSASNFANRRMWNLFSPWPYQIYRDSGQMQILKDFSEATSEQDIIKSALPSQQNNDTQVPLSFWVTRDQTDEWRASGNYFDLYTVRLYRGTLTNATFVTSQLMSVNFNAVKRADLAVVPSGGSFQISDTTETLDFGVLSTGQSRGCDVIVKTNSGYTLKASSANGGQLKHQTLNRYISYNFSIDGSNVNLSSSANNPVTVSERPGQTVSPASGFVLPTKVTIGNVSGAESGNYQDAITLTIQAR